ncbi:putative PAP/25A-associated [Plasmopara halstedii]
MCINLVLTLIMATWPKPPRSPSIGNGRNESDGADLQNLGTFDVFHSGSGQLSGFSQNVATFSALNSVGLNPNMNLQRMPPSMAPPLPPPSLYLTDNGRPLYQQHQQQEVTMGSALSSLGGVELEHQNTNDFVHFGSLDSMREVRKTVVTNRNDLDLSNSMLKLNLGKETFGVNEHGSIGGSGGWSDKSASLRDQMNAQMAALYQQPMSRTTDRLLSPHLQHPPHYSELERAVIQNSRCGGMTDHNSHDQHLSKKAMQSVINSGSSVYNLSNNLSLKGQASSVSPNRKTHSRSSTMSRTRRSPGKSPHLHRDNSSPSLLSGGPHNSVHVSPEVAKPNDNIKVQVSLGVKECSAGRVLLVGLFRLGQPTNDKPIFVKQVLFENKLHHNHRCLNTRITFRAPRSPGEFEFRVFEDKSGHTSHHVNGKRSSDEQHSKVAYSNATISRSNRLKVCLEYSHFIDTLRATHDKFQQGVANGDAGFVLSALLALMRLVDQVETVFLHGHALLGDMMDACLRLLERPADNVAQWFAATETIPLPIETFHGTMCNVLNAVEANRYVRELIADDQLAEIAHAQRKRFCQVSGLYFANKDERCAFWLEHFGFASIDFGPSGSKSDAECKVLQTSPFVTRALTQWVEQEASTLIPDRTAFRASRQSIYNQVHSNVIAKLSFTCVLDVFGSSANEFGNEYSDMDMCLVLPDDNCPTLEEKQRMLLEVVDHLEARPDLFASVDTTRLTARIPIVMFVSRASGIECDLCMENRLAQRNTSLLRAYASADPRVRSLAYVLKHFVKQRRMNCAAEGTLSSYGYLLMLIHFLQRQNPPVLPVLQMLPPNWPDESCDNLPSVICRGPSDELEGLADGIETYFYDPYAFPEPKDKLALLRGYCSRNRQTVGELMLSFFRYYGLQFDATRDIVSVRCPDARTMTKEEKRQTCQWRFTTRLSIEDPFEVSYDVAHVLKGSRDKYIRQQFVRAYVLLMNGAIQSHSKSDSSQMDDEAIERIMSIVNEQVVEVPFLQVPPPSNSVSPV